jgi:hypothetical protein
VCGLWLVVRVVGAKACSQFFIFIFFIRNLSVGHMTLLPGYAIASLLVKILVNV